MESDERIERRPKEVCADGQTVLIDQLLPFKSWVCEEDGGKGDGRGEPRGKGGHALLFDCFLRAPDGETAGKQTNRAHYRHFQDLLRRGSGKALAHVVEIGNYKDREDRTFPGNQRRHSHPALAG